MRFLPRLLSLALAMAGGISAPAQISYNGGTYTQNFDTLPATGTFLLAGPGPFALNGAPINAAGLAGWSLVKYAGTGANAIFQVNTGSGNAGAVYSYGAVSTLERALGSLGSGGVSSRVGVALTNDTGSTISEFTVGYTGEQWRHGGATTPNKLTFGYAVGATDINTGTFTTVPALDFTGLVITTTAGALTGNAAANQSVLSATISGITWGPGQTLVLRWSDVDDPGSDDGLAVDDFTFSAGGGPSVPAVSSTIPSSGAVNVAANSGVSVTFNLPVTVSDNWFSLVGSISGINTAGVIGGPTSFTFVPAPGFSEGETVTLTIFANQVVDASTGLNPLEADYVTSFTTFSSTPLPIHTVQGTGPVSPYVSQIVSVDGVVTASFQGAGGLGGFYLQETEADYDSDGTTSEGIFIFNTAFNVTVGELVRVTGTVVEFGPAPRTQTELSNVTNVVRLGNAPLPTAMTVNLPFASLTDAERYEGMRVVLPQTLTVTDTFNLGRYGEIVLSLGRLPNPTNVVAPGAPALAQAGANLLNQIVIDDGIVPQNQDPTPFLLDSAGRGLTRRTGSTTAEVAGILDEKFGSYVIEPTSSLVFVDANPRFDPPVVHGSLRVAIGNVLNLFNGNGSGGGFPTSRGADTVAEYERQSDKIVAGIMALAPDIMGLTEIENDGAAPTSALAQLVERLNAAAPAGSTYAFVDTTGVDLTSDEIRNAFIYRTEAVELVGAPAAFNGTYFVGLARSPIAQTFREKATGAVLTVSINHFKSKGSASTGTAATDGLSPNPNLDQNDGQGLSNYLRIRQAETLVQWLATDPTGSGDADFLIIGDLNAYAKEEPIAAIENAGYVNLTEVAEGEGGYSYSFNGEFGHLDHALASTDLAPQVVDAATWHANSDEPAYYDYNLEFKSAAQQAINVGTPYRYSDHDPVIVGLNLLASPAFTTQPVTQTVNEGETVTFTAAAKGFPAPSYRWQFNGADIPGATEATFTIESATIADAGSYAVIATNSVDSTISVAATLTVLDITPPVLTLPADLVLEATSPNGAVGTFAVSATDNVDGLIAATADPLSGSTFAIGVTTVNVSATDAAGNPVSGSFIVTVSDTTAPTLTLSVSPNVIRSPNHKMVRVTVTASVTDLGDNAPITRITAISSNELVNGINDGNTSPDWEILGPLTANVRAERSGSGTGRVYTLTVESKDRFNNVTTKTVTVSVPL